MENVSKALLIAAIVLIIILIIAFGLRIFTSSSETNKLGINFGKKLIKNTEEAKDIAVSELNKNLYTELQYLKSTGKQSINTNIYIKSTDIVEAVIEDERFDCSWENWFGTIDNEFGLIRKNDKNTLEFEIAGNALYIYNMDIFSKKTKITIDLPQRKITFNNTNSFNISKAPLSTTQYSVYIFSKLKNIKASSSSKDPKFDIPGSFKLYSFSVIDGNTKAYKNNLIPVLDNNNIPCLFDKVGGKFYYNETNTDFLYALK